MKFKREERCNRALVDKHLREVCAIVANCSIFSLVSDGTILTRFLNNKVALFDASVFDDDDDETDEESENKKAPKSSSRKRSAAAKAGAEKVKRRRRGRRQISNRRVPISNRKLNIKMIRTLSFE